MSDCLEAWFLCSDSSLDVVLVLRLFSVFWAYLINLFPVIPVSVRRVGLASSLSVFFAFWSVSKLIPIVSRTRSPYCLPLTPRGCQAKQLPIFFLDDPLLGYSTARDSNSVLLPLPSLSHSHLFSLFSSGFRLNFLWLAHEWDIDCGRQWGVVSSVCYLAAAGKIYSIFSFFCGE